MRRTGMVLGILIACGGVAASAAAQTHDAVLEVVMDADSVIDVRGRIRHTTVIVLPEDEVILDFVVGDADYWALSGAENVAYVKPMAEGALSNIALVCASGRVYAFRVAESTLHPPHLVVRVTRATGAPPGLAHRRDREAYDASAQAAAARAQAAQDAAAAAVARVEADLAKEVADFQRGYPAQLRFRYRLDPAAAAPPFLVEGMWDDGRFTYLRSHAQESPALYELKDGAPSLVAYDLTGDGLYIARRVLGDGWLQIGKARAEWRVADQPAQRADRRRPTRRWLTAAAVVSAVVAAFAAGT